MRPEACKHEHEIAGAIQKWERNYRRIIEEDKAEPLPERYRMTAIKCLLVGEIKRHVTLREDELDTYQQLRDVVMKYGVNRRIKKESGNIAMEVDAAMDNEAADQNWNPGSINAMNDNYGTTWGEQWTWDQVNYVNK